MAVVTKDITVPFTACRYCDCPTSTTSSIEDGMRICSGCGAEWDPVGNHTEIEVVDYWRCDECEVTSNTDASMENNGHNGMCKTCHDDYIEHTNHMNEQQCACGNDADVVKGDNGQHGMCSECVIKEYDKVPKGQEWEW